MPTVHAPFPFTISDYLTPDDAIHYRVCDREGGIVADSILTLEDARLIAAAPELLKACMLGLHESQSLIHDHLTGTPQWEPALAALQPIRDAIAKAEGR